MMKIVGNNCYAFVVIVRILRTEEIVVGSPIRVI